MVDWFPSVGVDVGKLRFGALWSVTTTVTRVVVLMLFPVSFAMMVILYSPVVVSDVLAFQILDWFDVLKSSISVSAVPVMFARTVCTA